MSKLKVVFGFKKGEQRRGNKERSGEVMRGEEYEN